MEKPLCSSNTNSVKLSEKINAKHVELAEHDQSDHVGIGALTVQLRDLESELAEKEGRWLELSELVENSD